MRNYMAWDWMDGNPGDSFMQPFSFREKNRSGWFGQELCRLTIMEKSCVPSTGTTSSHQVVQVLLLKWDPAEFLQTPNIWPSRVRQERGHCGSTAFNATLNLEWSTPILISLQKQLYGTQTQAALPEVFISYSVFLFCQLGGHTRLNQCHLYQQCTPTHTCFNPRLD